MSQGYTDGYENQTKVIYWWVMKNQGYVLMGDENIATRSRQDPSPVFPPGITAQSSLSVYHDFIEHNGS